MSDAYLGQTIDLVLGQEFLTWLWFSCETKPLGFRDKDGRNFLVAMEQRIMVQGGEGENLETASVSGSLSELKEVRLGLCTGKKVVRGLVRFEFDSMIWQTTLKAEDFSLSSFKTPKIERDEDDDPDALFLEKFYLMEQCLGFIDSCYLAFLQLRLSANWAEEVKAMHLWMTKN